MKKLSFLIALLLSACMVANAQIQNTFYGVTLGETKLEDAILLLEEAGFERVLSDTFWKCDCEIDGIVWDHVEMKFMSSQRTGNVQALYEVVCTQPAYIPVTRTEDEVILVDPEYAKVQIARIDKFGKKVDKIYKKKKYKKYLKEENYDPSCLLCGLNKFYDDNNTTLFFHVGDVAGGPDTRCYTTLAEYDLSKGNF